MKTLSATAAGNPYNDMLQEMLKSGQGPADLRKELAFPLFPQIIGTDGNPTTEVFSAPDGQRLNDVGGDWVYSHLKSVDPVQRQLAESALASPAAWGKAMIAIKEPKCIPAYAHAKALQAWFQYCVRKGSIK
jgi:hypothetical protein